MKKLTIQRKITMLVVVVVLTLAIMIGGVLIPQRTILSSASTSVSLFNATGQMTRAQAQNILEAIGDTEAQGFTNASMDRGRQFRIFPDIALASDNAQNLARLNFRLVNVTGDRVTFMASTSYRFSEFQSSNDESNYNLSTVRENLLGDFDYIQRRIPNVNNHILNKGSTADFAVATDRIWLPSLYEVQDGTGWTLNNNLRRPVETNNHHSWLRSGNSYTFGEVQDYFVYIISSLDGSLSVISVRDVNLRGIRPAIHISLSSLQDASEDGASGGAVRPPDENNNNNNNEEEHDRVATWIIIVSVIVGLLVLAIIINIFAWIFSRKRRRNRGRRY
ncbi:MAG: hypothetical protein FWE22_02205 [Firmicutes bacterium]|nr:hypothetical protein [Bacillota bacterium]